MGDDKARTAFALFDADGSGTLSLGEMTRYLLSVFRMQYQLDPAVKRSTGCTAEELAHATAREVFDKFGTSAHSALSFEEFRTWYSRDVTNPSDGVTTPRVMEVSEWHRALENVLDGEED